MLQSKLLLLIVTLSVATTNVFAKPRTVYLDKELKESKFTEFVEIIGYTDSTIIYKIIESGKTESAKISGAYIQKHVSQTHTTGSWPMKGNQVLIVIGQNGLVSLFANKQGDNYRFWSPHETGSVALFFFKKPAVKLPDNTGIDPNSNNYDSCWDGCLLPIDKLGTYGKG